MKRTASAGWVFKSAHSRRKSARVDGAFAGSLGSADTWRQANPDNQDRFSWFDHRPKVFDDNRGLRIDLLLASSLAQRA